MFGGLSREKTIGREIEKYRGVGTEEVAIGIKERGVF
jgi:hypothetical protein